MNPDYDYLFKVRLILSLRAVIALEPMAGHAWCVAGRLLHTCALANNFLSVSCRSCCSLETPASASPVCCFDLRYVVVPAARHWSHLLTTPQMSVVERSC